MTDLNTRALEAESILNSLSVNTIGMKKPIAIIRAQRERIEALEDLNARIREGREPGLQSQVDYHKAMATEYRARIAEIEPRYVELLGAACRVTLSFDHRLGEDFRAENVAELKEVINRHGPYRNHYGDASLQREEGE